MIWMGEERSPQGNGAPCTARAVAVSWPGWLAWRKKNAGPKEGGPAGLGKPEEINSTLHQVRRSGKTPL